MSSTRTIVILLLTAALGGCKSANHYVVAATGTVIGVEIAQDPKTQTPTAKLGYNRGELAIVPTGRPTCAEIGQDIKCAPSDGKANEATDVVMELRYGGIFDVGASSGIYQRLAVGTTAVTQPGASLMFAKSADGEVSTDARKALEALKGVPNVDREPTAVLSCLNQGFAANPAAYEEAAVQAGFSDYNAFGRAHASRENNKKMIEALDAARVDHGCG